MNDYQRFLVMRLHDLRMDYAFRDPMLVGDFRAHYRHWLCHPYPIHAGLLDFFHENPAVAAMCSLLSQFRPERVYSTPFMIITRTTAASQLNSGNPFFLRSL